MVTEPNTWTIKERIRDTLKKSGDINIWNADGNMTGFVSIEVGLPANNQVTGLNYPVCFITNHEDVDTDQPRGPVSSGSLGVSQHLIKFKILMFDHKEDGQESEHSLDDLSRLTKKYIKQNYQLRDPDDLTDASTALATALQGPITTRNFSAEFDGKPLDGRIITLTYLVHSS